MMLIVFLCLFAAQTFGATTTHKPHATNTHVTKHHTSHVPHTTQESIVNDRFTFSYDPQTHKMAAISKKECYIYSMSASEATDVHTPHGLHTLEAKLINMIDDTTQTIIHMSHDDVNAASHYLATTCNAAGWSSFKLN